MVEKRLTPVARDLRRASTDAERLLWSRLRARQLGPKFVRQFPIGPHVANFACRSLKLVIEVDGGQHGPDVDASRALTIEQFGFQVIRFWNHDVLTNIDGVLSAILLEIERHR